MKKTGVVLFTILMIAMSSIVVQGLTEEQCDSTAVAQDAAVRECDNEGDAEQNIVLAQRKCYAPARLCLPKWTEEELQGCLDQAAEQCVVLNPTEKLKIEEKKELLPDILPPKEEVAPPAPTPAPVAPAEPEGISKTTWIIALLVLIAVVWWLKKRK